MNVELTVTEDTTLYARWEKQNEKPEERLEATIAFDADGGEMESGNITAKVGEISLLFLSAPKRVMSLPAGMTNDICAGQAGETYTVTGDVILKAHYEKKAEVTYLNLITFREYQFS